MFGEKTLPGSNNFTSRSHQIVFIEWSDMISCNTNMMIMMNIINEEMIKRKSTYIIRSHCQS